MGMFGHLATAWDGKVWPGIFGRIGIMTWIRVLAWTLQTMELITIVPTLSVILVLLLLHNHFNTSLSSS